MLLLHFSSPVGHLHVGHLIRNAFIINAIQDVFLLQRQTGVSFLGLLAHATHFALGGSVSYSVRLLGGLHSKICHLLAIPGLVHSQTSETTTLFRQISTTVSYTQSLQIRRKIFCKIYLWNTKLKLFFVRQNFLCYLTKNIKFLYYWYSFVRFIYVLFQYVRSNCYVFLWMT